MLAERDGGYESDVEEPIVAPVVDASTSPPQKRHKS